MPTGKTCDGCVPKFVQSILELPATGQIYMEDRKKVWPERSPELIRPMAYTVRKTGQQSCVKTTTFESRTNKLKNSQNIERHKLDQIDARNT